jgi:hypothetical protein
LSKSSSFRFAVTTVRFKAEDEEGGAGVVGLLAFASFVGVAGGTDAASEGVIVDAKDAIAVFRSCFSLHRMYCNQFIFTRVC